LSAPTLRVENLRVEVASTGHDIVSEVSFSIDAGEVLALVGESGSGKTTVGLAILGHARRGAKITGGTVEVDGADILGLAPSALRRVRGGTISYIPQDPATALNPALRIGTQLEETLAVHGKARDRAVRVGEVLAEVALPADRTFLRRYPHQLSGGQQQRVALAIAFACRPRVIVLDEPTTGLDVTTQAHVLTTVKMLCDTHDVAALYVSHDLAVVASLARRVAVMYAGRVVETAPSVALFEAPLHPYTRRLVAAIPQFSDEQALVGIPGIAPRPGHRPAGCYFAPRCHHAVDLCRETFPAQAEAAGDHEVRCHRFAEALNGEVARPSSVASSPETSDVLVSLRTVQASHGDRQVVFDASLELRGHRCVALVGESGSGKTTLARCIVGLHPSWTGTIALRGEPLAASARSRSRDSRRELQYVFQNPYSSLNPRKTVGQIIGQPLRMFFSTDRRATHEQTMQVLARVQLSGTVIQRLPHELSGGERQRVAIARALAAKPALLICDEVTSALDVSVQAAIVDLVDELRRELGVGVLFVTHNLALIRTIAQEVAVMSAGRIVEFGPVDQVLDAPGADYTKRLLADTPTLESRLSSV
jgi:peptide/nickel transport system ATP-binding protein